MEKSIDVKSIFGNYPGKGRDCLIPILQDIQEKYGYLPREAIVETAKYLNLASSKIFGVATFYNQFRFQPIGKYHIQLCRGTACHVKGSGKLLETVIKNLGIEPGNTTRDMVFSLEVVACMGACGLSPVICINGEFIAKVSPAKIVNIIDEFRKKEEHENEKRSN